MMHLPRFVIAGTQSGVGKTTVTLGIMAALSRRGMKLGPYKAGPDYIDPGFHSYVTGSKSRNLDLWLLNEEKINYLFQKNSQYVELSIIEGVMGLYDGRGLGLEASTAHLAKVLKAPTILVIDGSGIAISAAALVLGYKMFDSGLNLAGVILNRVSGESHYRMLKSVIEKETGIRVYGYLAKTQEIQLKSRHLGLIPGQEVLGFTNQIDQLVEMVEESIDLAGLIKLADEAPDLADVSPPEELPKVSRVLSGSMELRLGVAYDEAFHFYYQDNLDLLSELGMELVYFSPLGDKRLPENLDGLYIGGGFPEIFARQLAENSAMCESVYNAILNGLPTYAECGGMMYLTQGIHILDGNYYSLVGVIPTTCSMTNRLQRFGYVEVQMGENVFESRNVVVPAHEFHYSKLDDGDRLDYSYNVQRGERKWQCGVKLKNLLVGYPHLHFYSKLCLVYGFVEKCREFHVQK